MVNKVKNDRSHDEYIFSNEMKGKIVSKVKNDQSETNNCYT